MDSYFH